jgi:uncharacterized protein (DUF302 family)
MRPRTWLWLGAGLVAGLVVAGAGMKVVMPSMMIVTEESKLGFDETVAALETAIKEQGWASPGTMDMNASMAKHGVTFAPRVKLVQLCKAEYASEVLTSDRYVASLMPCKFAVWESDDGRVYISKMNTGLMGKLFGGTIAKVMGGSVAKDEHAMLADIVS